jgi:hypothetical protein
MSLRVIICMTLCLLVMSIKMWHAWMFVARYICSNFILQALHPALPAHIAQCGNSSIVFSGGGVLWRRGDKEEAAAQEKEMEHSACEYESSSFSNDPITIRQINC